MELSPLNSRAYPNQNYSGGPRKFQNKCCNTQKCIIVSRRLQKCLEKIENCPEISPNLRGSKCAQRMQNKPQRQFREHDEKRRSDRCNGGQVG
jgi:hypothetical protein